MTTTPGPEARYAIRYKPSAAKAFRRIHPREQQRLRSAIEDLACNPHPAGSVQLIDGVGEWRVRVGDYRVIYDINDDVLVILVLRIGHRREVYR